MDKGLLKRALIKQREINRTLRAQLRAEIMLSNALSGLKWHKKDQTEPALEKVRSALALKQQVTNTPQNVTRFYPTGRKSA